MASGPITSWQIHGETVETVADFIFLGSKITADGDCSHEIKRHLLLGRKIMTSLDSILKSRKVHGFSSGHVWMWESDYKESWALKNWSFWTLVLEKILESPLDCKEMQPVHPKGDQSWVFIGRTDVESKLKLQYFGHLMPKADSFEKTLKLGRLRGGGEGDNRGWDGWMASPTQWTWVWVDSWSSWWTGKPGMLRFFGSQGVRHDWVTELNWFTYLPYILYMCV